MHSNRLAMAAGAPVLAVSTHSGNRNRVFGRTSKLFLGAAVIATLAAAASTASAGGVPCIDDAMCNTGEYCDSGTLYCTVKLADDSPCTRNGECLSGVCISGTCGPSVTGCNVDVDCPSSQWCNESLHTCEDKLVNGTPIPTDGGHINGTCTAPNAQLTCVSGVCDLHDNQCGLDDGSGPCTPANAGVVCRSGECQVSNVCGATGTTTTTTTTTLPEATGYVPPDAKTLKCEAAVAKAAAKLWSAIAKCRSKAAASALAATPFDSAACTSAAATKFDEKTAALKDCPACLQGASLAAVRSFVETNGDSSDVLLYCAGTTPLP